MKDSPLYLMIGLPKTGKTTFLAALWHVVETGEISSSLKLKRLEGDQEYINLMRDRWHACKQVPRTVRGEQQLVGMELEEPQGSDCVKIMIPDLSGEVFEDHFVDRRWSKLYAEMVSSAKGALLFIHPNVNEPTTIFDIIPHIDLLGEEEEETENDFQEREFSNEYVSTQVKLVDLLQFIQKHALRQEPFKLSIIISAWDIVQSTGGVLPEDWLSTRLPLLSQYLRCNQEEFLAATFGVSAQGGSLEGSEDRDRLLKLSKPSDRITVCHQAGTSHDITEPVRWLMQSHEE